MSIYKRSGYILFLFLFCFCINKFSFAQGGNTPCSATSITSGGCLAGTTVGQTYSVNAANGGTPTCAAPGAPDVWYAFTPTLSTTYSISTAAGSMTDSGMSLYSATTCSTGLTQIGCDDESGPGSMSALMMYLTSGTTYYIRVWNYSSGTGTFSLCITSTTVNDDCAGAISLTPGTPCVSGTNVGSTTSATDPWPSCWISAQSNTVWYKFVADDDSMTVDLGSGTLGATAEAGVYNGSCGAPGTQMGCTENSTQIVMTTLVPGNTYYIIIDSQGTAVGTFCICVFDTPPPNPPVGNSCSNPRTLYPFTSCTSVTSAQYDNHDNQLGSAGDTPGSAAGFPLVGASPDPTCTSNDATQRGYWADFVATNTLTTFTDNDAASAPPLVCATAQDYAVYTGSCGSLTQAACFSLGGSCGINCCNPSSFNMTTIIGTHYYVLITPSGATSPGTDVRFLCITSASPSIPGGGVASNTCSAAPSINANTTYTINNANADVAGTEPLLCVGSSENTLFVNWTVPAGWSNPTYVHMFNQDCNSTIGMQLSIFAVGTTCSSSGPACEIATNAGNTNNYTGSFTAVAGNTYLIALDGNAGAGCTFNFLIDQLVLLPIELLNFEAKLKNNITELNWSTETETNNDYFTLEKSKDGIDFEKVNDVKGAGTSLTINNYKAYDFSPYNEITYYRLKQTNFNKTFKYSNIISVENNDYTDKIMNLRPNPTNDFVTFELQIISKGDIYTQLYNYTGNLELESFQSLEKGINTLNVEMSELNSGVYILKVYIQSTGKTLMHKIIKH